MKLIGLTGGIATGKSTVSGFLQAQGLVVLDADLLAREVVAPSSFGLRALVQIFGKTILHKAGQDFQAGAELDRNILREKLFSDPKARRVVENITHPLIQWRAQQEFAILRRERAELAFYDAALIYEKNLMPQFDHVLVVHTEDAVQLQRLMKRDKIPQAEAEKRIATQWPIAKKRAAADLLVDNNGTLEETKRQVLELLKKLRGT